jgi:hypothetical protein
MSVEILLLYAAFTLAKRHRENVWNNDFGFICMSVEILLKATFIYAIWDHKKCQQPGLWLHLPMSV